MAVKANAEITLTTIRDVQSVTRYYLLQSSTSSVPAKPTANPPGGNWVKAEPSYTTGSTNSLYFTDLTVFSDGTFDYSDVSLSSSYEAAKAAYNKAVAAQDSIDNLSIGGRNLLLGTATEHPSRTDDPQYIANYAMSDYGKSLFNNTETEFTLSFDFEIQGDYSGASSSSRIYAMINGTAVSPANAVYVKDAPATGHYEATCRMTEAQVTSGAGTCRARWNGRPTDCTFTVRNFKAEIGNKATDWTPAPEDVEVEMTSMRTDLQAQIDGKIQTYYQASAPAWSDTAERAKHDGDLWYCTTTAGTYTAGNVYRFNASANTWTVYSASGDLFDKVDGKSTIFYGTTSGTYEGVQAGDYLIDSTDGCSYRYSGSGWVKVTDYRAAIDSIEIGGRNLLLNSADLRDWPVTSNSYGGVEEGAWHYARSGVTSNVNAMARNWIGTGILADYYNKTITISLEIMSPDWSALNEGSSYTGLGALAAQLVTTSRIPYSGSAAPSGSVGRYAFMRISNSAFYHQPESLVNGEWIRITSKPITIDDSLWTSDVTKIDGFPYLEFYFLFRRNGEIYFRKPKIEFGNKATDWTPAPEDVDTSVSAIEALANTALADAVEYIVGTQTEATGTWTGVTRDVSLAAGKTIAYKLPYAGSGNASLTLTLAGGGTTEAVPVYLNTTRVTTHFGAGAVINMTYDGAAWRAASIPNTNNYDRRLHNTAIKAAVAVTKAHLIAGTADGYKMLAASLPFDLAYPILYASAAISANATAKTAYEAMPDVNFSTTGTIQSGTANKILWLKGTVTGNTFTIAASNWLTTVVPTEDDGMYYIPLGVMSSATVGYFATSDRLYAFVDGAFQPLDNASRKLAEKAREEVVDAEERVRVYAESTMSQKADEIEISISTVTGTLAAGIQDCQESIAQTDEALSSSVGNLSQRISDQEDALLDYKHETSTYFRFNTDGLNIGKQEDGDESPYSINIDNEKMGFLQNGVEIAYVQYNKMHINAIEAMDRLSVGAAADGGYFDFISTEYGMGVKWRAVNQSGGSTPRGVMKAAMAKRAAEYVAVEDEDGVFKVDFGGDTK